MYNKNMRRRTTLFIVGILLYSYVLPSIASAAAGTFEVAGWIPYWIVDEGTQDARKHLDVLTHIYPFGYSVKQDGSLNDLADIQDSDWKRLFKSAKTKNVAVIPTVMWNDGKNIHRVLSDPKLRTKHINEITSMVKKGKYAGVDIDYEGKWAETKDYFSAFLKELKATLGTRTLTCTIEARTPPDSLYAKIPNPIKYSNDYAAIGKYCDRVQIMAYDQGRADLKENAANTGAPYIPVADIDWVRKVLNLTVQTIPREKILLGVPTYGRRYEVTVYSSGYHSFDRLSSPNHDVALEIAEEFGSMPSRNVAGEMSFTYAAQPSPLFTSTLPIPANTPVGNTMSAKALAFAKATSRPAKFHLVWWSDAEAIKQKVDLAREMGIRGVAIFKIDGGEDPAIWKLFPKK
jgi:spore germination protein